MYHFNRFIFNFNRVQWNWKFLQKFQLSRNNVRIEARSFPRIRGNKIRSLTAQYVSTKKKKKKNCQNCENFTRIYCILSSKREIEEEKRKNEQRDWTSRGEIKFSRRENGLLASPRLENCNCTRWKCPIWRAIWRVKIEADGGGRRKKIGEERFVSD